MSGHVTPVQPRKEPDPELGARWALLASGPTLAKGIPPASGVGSDRAAVPCVIPRDSL